MDITCAIATTINALYKLCRSGSAPKRTPLVLRTLDQGVADGDPKAVYAACVTAAKIFDEIEDEDNWGPANGAAEWLLKRGYLPSAEDVDLLVRP